LRLWRIYREIHGPGLDGAGGLFAAGRWSKAGNRVVYFSDTPPLRNPAGTSECGTQWLQGNTGALLSVPSFIVPEQRNFFLTRSIRKQSACGRSPSARFNSTFA